VDAKDQEAKRYYERFGFVALPSNELETVLAGQNDSSGVRIAQMILTETQGLREGRMYALTQDLRFAFRQLRKAPGFTVTVVLTLALGIGATTAIFSLVEGILLRPLPFSNSARLVRLEIALSQGLGIAVTAREIATYASASSASLLRVGGYMSTSYELSGGAVPEEISAARSTAGVLTTLGVEPSVGAGFYATGRRLASAPLAVISYALWLEPLPPLGDPGCARPIPCSRSQNLLHHRCHAPRF